MVSSNDHSIYYLDEEEEDWDVVSSPNPLWDDHSIYSFTYPLMFLGLVFIGAELIHLGTSFEVRT